MNDRTSMDAAEFLSTVHKHLSAMLADGEPGMQGYAWVLADEPEAGVTVMAIDLEPQEAWTLAIMRMVEPSTRMMIFCLDRYGKPGQGTTLGDLVAGYFYERGHDYRPFIVEYAPAGPPRVLWFNWHNKLWNEAIVLEFRQSIAALRQMTDAEMKRRGM
jgi:hypothetical protein